MEGKGKGRYMHACMVLGNGLWDVSSRLRGKRRERDGWMDGWKDGMRCR